MAGGEKNKSLSSSLTERALLSYMIRLNYAYAGKYLLTLTGRSDGYSAFGANNKYAFFPSAAAAWNISSEEFMENTRNWLDMMKLRVSYGANGNQGINAYQTLDRLSLTQYVWGDGGNTVNGVYLPTNGVGNPNLKWETTYTFNTGIDFGLFNGRLSGNIDFYIANTKDLLMNRTVPYMNGYRSILDNIGQTRNVGVEFALNSINIETKDNYHAILTASRQNSVYYIEQYRKGNKAIQYENSYIKDGNKIKISNKTHYNSNTENFSLISDGINKEKVKGSEDIQNLEWQDLSELKINSLYSAIYSKVKKINYEKRDCYLIQDFGQEIVVEANTGNIIRMVSSLPEEQTTTFEYFREFDTVQDSDIIRPETTDYMEK